MGVLDNFNYNNINRVGINEFQILSSTTIRGRLIDNIVNEALNLVWMASILTLRI